MMEKSIYFTAILIALTAVFAALFGCTSSMTNLVSSGEVSVERMPSKGNTQIFKVYVYKEGDELVVSGRIKRLIKNNLPSRGHVDIAVLSPKGETIAKTSTAYTPLIISRGGPHRASHFTARFSDMLPEVSTVRLSYHAQRYVGAEKTFDCGDNAAVSPGEVLAMK